MTDHDLEGRLRAWYRAEVEDSDRAPIALRSVVPSLAVPSTAGLNRLGALSTTLAAATIAVAALVGLTMMTQPPAVGPSLAPGPSTVAVPSLGPATAMPSTAPAGSASPSERVHGWPDTSRNGPGLFSWGAGCHGAFCTYGWMHNGYGGGNVEITIGEGGVLKDGASPATVAGHDALYQSIESDDGRLQEDWQVEVDDVPIHIRLIASPEASEAELAEAHAIIDSLYYMEPVGRVGFRLVFRLATENWDSG